MNFAWKKWAIIGGIAILGAGVFTLWLFTTRCPSCKKFFALETVTAERLASRTERKREYKNGQWRERYVQVSSVRITKKCRHCGRITAKYEDRTR